MEAVDKPKHTVLEDIQRQRILIVHPPPAVSQINFPSQEVTLSESLDVADEAVSTERPDMVVLFSDEHSNELEDHVMTWLVEGFKGKLLLFDPQQRITDYSELVSGQVVDDFIAGPLSTQRFATILQSKMLQGTRFAAPRAMTTYDLFRNLFERGLSAIFFFTESLDRCVAANLKAEDLTGHSFASLKRTRLQDLCAPQDWENTQRTIRRAKHRYFDAKGRMEILEKTGLRKPGEFSCCYFQFGRRHFVKIEVQTLTRGESPIP